MTVNSSVRLLVLRWQYDRVVHIELQKLSIAWQILIVVFFVVGIAGVITSAEENNGYPQETIYKGC
ncbi:hypothetical protein [Coleofasciculus sp. H7-2]|uniref:hypothetical protein n=1 Tax=Coleofasciculus sp. H7-2 TaxID=3351545 RepID=UPI003670F4DB